MKYQVSDIAVNEYAARLLNGGPLGTVFPGKMSECDFSETQRDVIRQARAAKKAMQKSTKSQPCKATETEIEEVAPVEISNRQKTKPLTKLRKLLFLQSGRCFYCGEQLEEKEANIEHLNPKSRGGKSSDDNEVVCHASLNETFGAMDLKRKFEFVLKNAGAFSCP